MAEDKKTVEELEKENEALKKEAAEKEQLLSEAHKSLSEAEKSPASNRKIFTVDKEKYALVVAKSTAKIDGKVVEITEKTLRADQGLVKLLVEKGSGVLVKASELEYKNKKKEG